MTQSIARTVFIPAAGTTASSFSQLLNAPIFWWPEAEPGDALDYYADATAWLTDAGDTLVSVSVAAEPSGTGELQLNSVTATGAGLIGPLWMQGGVAGRTYTVEITAVTAGGRQTVWLVGLCIDATTASSPLPTPPSPFPGMPVTWSSGGLPIYGLLGADGAYLLGADGAYLTYQ